MIETVAGLECLGHGDWMNGNGSRKVYAIDDKTVVKIPYEHGNSGDNDNEFHIWTQIQDTKWAKWFFPCIDIQANGWLIMERALYVPKAIGMDFVNLEDDWAADPLRKLIDKFGLWDFKPQNIGIKQDGTWAILDYGYASLPRIRRRKMASKN